MMKKRSLGLLGWPLCTELEAQVVVSINVFTAAVGTGLLPCTSNWGLLVCFGGMCDWQVLSPSINQNPYRCPSIIVP